MMSDYYTCDLCGLERQSQYLYTLRIHDVGDPVIPHGIQVIVACSRCRRKLLALSGIQVAEALYGLIRDNE